MVFMGFLVLNTLYGNGQGTNCCNGHPGPSPITARLVGLQLRNPLILLALDKGNALSLSEARHPKTHRGGECCQANSQFACLS